VAGGTRPVQAKAHDHLQRRRGGLQRLMGDDEAATVKTMEQYKQIMSELIAGIAAAWWILPGTTAGRVHQRGGWGAMRGGGSERIQVQKR